MVVLNAGYIKGGNVIDLKSYCIKEGKEYLPKEWDYEKNSPISPETINHSSIMRVWWK